MFFCGLFILFTYDYYTKEDSHFFGTKSFEVIEAAKKLADKNETIYFYLLPTFKYSNLLWYELPSIRDVCENIEYDYTEAAAWHEMSYYNGFGYIVDITEASDEGIYIFENQFVDRFSMLDYCIENVNDLQTVVLFDSKDKISKRRYIGLLFRKNLVYSSKSEHWRINYHC